MKKSLFIFFFMVLISAFASKAALNADWRIHMPFDSYAVAVYETPKRVYFLNRTFEYHEDIPSRRVPSHSLHYYDKEGDELLTVNTRDGADGNAVASVAYNSEKGYLIVIYTDLNIDFIMDDGRIFNLPALMTTTLPGKKETSGITFDNANDRVYIATSFGYVSLNDKKYEVAESRNYETALTSVARSGDKILIAKDGKIFSAPASEQRFNIEDYVPLDIKGDEYQDILPLTEGRICLVKPGKLGYAMILGPTDDGYEELDSAYDSYIYNHQAYNDGYFIIGNLGVIKVRDSGKYSVISIPDDVKQLPAMMTDDKNLWVLKDMKGLRHYEKNGDSWTLKQDFMRPNSPAVYISTGMAYHPTYGLLAGNNGLDYALSDGSQQTRSNVSALKGSFWKEYSPIYRHSSKYERVYNFQGMSIDPQDTRYVYRTSMLNGMMRINLEDPEDVLLIGNNTNSLKTHFDYVEMVPDLEVWANLVRFSPPGFDNEGRMWTAYNDADNGKIRLYYWNAADRKASTSPAAFRPMKYIELKGIGGMNSDYSTVLKHSANKNMIAIASDYLGGGVYLLDHKGTPETTSDDRYVYIQTPHDQDGGTVNFLGVNKIVEDPETGLIWILSQRGPFTLNPVTAFENPNQINRVKVARNDGTNLADYLLNEINVFDMAIDGEGRKWFCTSNGLICTSRDGRSILAEFTEDNSYLPSNNVYTACYNPESSSLMLGTGAGLAEIFPSGSGGGSSSASNAVRIYPNPVEPDYYGWVRIDNIADGSLVKITDAKGGLVKEMGPVEGGGVEWDVTGLNNQRVNTGVYYIMVSPGASGGDSSINKILVLN